MSLNFKEPAINPREHLVNRPHKNRVGLSPEQINQRKQQARLVRKRQIEQNEIKQRFFDWIDNLQAELKLTNEQFADRLCQKGGQATSQTVKLWKRRWGHYPNDKNFRALKRLEREARIKVTDLIFVIRVVSR